MKEFVELIKTNPEVREKVEALCKNKEATEADFIALAAEYGITITEEDFEQKPADGEMSDDELEAVSGGSKCICVIAGGGTGDASHATCGCVGLGFAFHGTEEDNCCICTLFGAGN